MSTGSNFINRECVKITPSGIKIKFTHITTIYKNRQWVKITPSGIKIKFTYSRSAKESGL